MGKGEWASSVSRHVDETSAWSCQRMTEPWATLKGIAVAALIAGLLSAAFLTPMTLHLRITDSIGPVARHFCPETGLLAPRYFSSRSSSSGPESWLACLDESGQRIERLDVHQKIVWTHIGLWFALTFPLVLPIALRLFWITGPTLKRRVAVRWRL